MVLVTRLCGRCGAAPAEVAHVCPPVENAIKPRHVCVPPGALWWADGSAAARLDVRSLRPYLERDGRRAPLVGRGSWADALPTRGGIVTSRNPALTTLRVRP